METEPLELAWLGHGSVAIRGAAMTFVVDPLLRNEVLALRRPRKVDLDLIEHVDVVLITHAHLDHLDVRSLHMFPRATTMLAPAGADRVLRRRGLESVRSIYTGVEVDFGGANVEVVPARHPGGHMRPKVGDEAVGYVIRCDASPSVYVAGDTGAFASMRQIGPVDVAVLPVGGWWRSVGANHLGPAEAVDAALAVGAEVLVPVHWGTFHPKFLGRAMHRSWQETAAELRRLIGERAPRIELRMLRPGESTTVHMLHPVGSPR